MTTPLVKLAAPTGEPLSILKARAKRLKREREELSHSQALDIVATDTYHGDSKSRFPVRWEHLEARALQVVDHNSAYQHTRGVFHDINLSDELVSLIRSDPEERSSSERLEKIRMLSVVQKVQTVLCGGKMVVETIFFLDSPFQNDPSRRLRIRLTPELEKTLISSNMTMVWGVLAQVFNEICTAPRSPHLFYGSDGFAPAAMALTYQQFTAFGSKVKEWENYLIRETDFPNRQLLIGMAKNQFVACLSTFGDKPHKFLSSPVEGTPQADKERSILLSVINVVNRNEALTPASKEALAQAFSFADDNGWEIEEETPKSLSIREFEATDPEKLSLAGQWPAEESAL